MPVIWYSRLVAHVSQHEGLEDHAHPFRQPGPGRRLAGPVAPWTPRCIASSSSAAAPAGWSSPRGSATSSGERGKAHITLIDKAAHAPVEAAAARDRRRQHGPGHARRSTTWRRPTGTASSTAPARWPASTGTRRVVQVAPFVDDEGRQVTPRQEIGYDTLVIAIGSLTNDFGTPGVKAHAIALETAEEAARFHRRLVNACIRANTQSEPLRPEQLQVAIIGAGATGTELAAELHKTTRQLVAYGLDRIDPDKDIKIHLIEAAPRILPRCPSGWRRRRPSCSRASRCACIRARRSRRCWRTACGSPTARSSRPSWWCGRPASRRRMCWQGHRRAGDQPAQPAGGAGDAADHARRQHLRHRRLRRLSLARPRPPGAAARPGRAPAGLASGQAAAAAHRGRAARRVALPRFRLAGLARRTIRPSAA